MLKLSVALIIIGKKWQLFTENCQFGLINDLLFETLFAFYVQQQISLMGSEIVGVHVFDIEMMVWIINYELFLKNRNGTGHEMEQQIEQKILTNLFWNGTANLESHQSY